MLRALGDSAYPVLLDELVAAVRIPPIGPAASEPAAEAMPRFVLKAMRRLERRADDLHHGSTDGDFHRARIAAKRARYAAELAARVLQDRVAGGATRLAERLADAQDRLGTAQDAAVAESAIRSTLEGRGVSATYAFEAGRLVERQRARGRVARDAFLTAWPQLRRRKLRKWAM
jgi:CHAD domain-containing protein